MISYNQKSIDDLADDERAVFDDAIERFSEGETYQRHKENVGLLTRLQREYAEHCTDCYIRYKKNRRGYQIE